ncbi:hypothetical protein [Nostoc sp.]|uniref:hypothetical protein n=1 Tax=Nostoc sp. TaxID=1180 RepID=UPI002FF5C343
MYQSRKRSPSLSKQRLRLSLCPMFAAYKSVIGTGLVRDRQTQIALVSAFAICTQTPSQRNKNGALLPWYQ